MPEEAFALSPISARPSLPSEADYEAIREAFMETARGRWFLSEYAKRNRNADTRMVLDAVERIEQNLTAQKQSASSGLVEALGAISSLISETKAIVAQALPDPAETLAAARDGARITREVATALRQCGADVRICDLLDAQVDAIDAGHQQIAAFAPRQTVLAAFDQLLQGVVDLASSNGATTAPAAPVETPQAEAPPPDEPPAAAESFAAPEALSAAEPEAAVSDFELEFAEPAEAVAPIETAMAETVAEEAVDTAIDFQIETDAIEPEPSVAVLACATSERAPFETDTAIEPVEHDTPTLEQIAADEAALDAEAAHDIAVLDMVAQEMSAPDDDDMPDFSRPDPAAAESQIVEASAESLAAEPVAMSVETATVAPDEMLDAADPSEAYEVLAAAGHDPEPLAVAAAPAVMANSAAPVVASPIASAPPTAGTPEPASPAAPASLGAAVLAHGVLRKPILNSDPLAALRRMTQAEKLAFFS